MNKFYIIASLLAAVSAVPDGSAQEDYIKSVDTEKINQDVVQKLTAEVLQMNVKAIIDKEVQKRVKEILEDKELADMHKFRDFTQQDWLKYDNLILQQKLENIMTSLGESKTLDAMWKDTEYEKGDKALRKFSVSLDLDSKEIEIASKATDQNGEPVYDWKLDQEKGEIQHIKRQPIVNPTKAEEETWKAANAIAQQMWAKANPGVEAPVVAQTATTAAAPVSAAPIAAAPVVATVAPVVVTQKISGDSTIPKSETDVEAEWENLELQRDLAFKIVYFFIFFIIATFGLLYAYFKIDEKEKAKEEREARAKGTFYGNANQSTFFDFLAGQMDDPNYTVNPYARTGVHAGAQPTAKASNQGQQQQMNDFGGARNLDNL